MSAPDVVIAEGCTATWKRILRELAPLYFDVGRYYHEQDPELMKEYMDTVSVPNA